MSLAGKRGVSGVGQGFCMGKLGSWTSGVLGRIGIDRGKGEDRIPCRGVLLYVLTSDRVFVRGCHALP